MTPYEQLRTRINELVPDRVITDVFHSRKLFPAIHLEAVLRAFIPNYEKYGYSLRLETIASLPCLIIGANLVKFDLTKPLFAPENADACSAVLELLK